MSLAQTSYPFVLASLNLAAGWLSYTLFDPAVGAVLGGAGLLVALAVVGRLLSAHLPFADRPV